MDNLLSKLMAASLPGCVVEFDVDEADQVGAFIDDAVGIDDALLSAVDLLEELGHE